MNRRGSVTALVTKPPSLGPSTSNAPLIPDNVIGNLYISDIVTARTVLSPNYYTPARPKIRYVLSLLHDQAVQPKIPTEAQKDDFVLKLVILRDLAGTDLLIHLQDTCDFISSSLANNDGGVLVHCQKGVSRSASVVLAYVMHDQSMDYDTALAYVKRRRSKICPNEGFEIQLRLWREMNFDIHEVSGSEKDAYMTWKRDYLNKVPSKVRNNEPKPADKENKETGDQENKQLLQKQTTAKDTTSADTGSLKKSSSRKNNTDVVLSKLRTGGWSPPVLRFDSFKHKLVRPQVAVA